VKKTCPSNSEGKSTNQAFNLISFNSRRWIEIILIILVSALCNIYIGLLLHHAQPDRVAVTNRVPIAILKPTAPQKKSKVKSQKSKFASRLLPLA
jgi:hypothetical protein